MYALTQRMRGDSYVVNRYYLRIIGFALLMNIFTSGTGFSQTKNGITFLETSGWQKILDKAKAENKFIFVDCYATWCGPCKLMDTDVYPKKEIGDLMNKYFVSVKVQIDSTKTDNERQVAWYADAHAIKNKYEITSLPTYLFFSPDGRPVHRFTGALKDSDFVAVSKNALDTTKQYYTLIQKHREGKSDNSTFRYFAYLAENVGEKKLADTIARQFIQYLNVQEDVMKDKKNISFLIKFSHVVQSGDMVFSFFSTREKEMDSLSGMQGFSEYVIRSAITREEINPRIWPGNKPIAGKPDWKGIYKIIQRRYNPKLAEVVLLDAKIRWHMEKQNWPEICRLQVEKIEKTGIAPANDIELIMLTNMFWSVHFRHCNDKRVLNKVIGFTETLLHSNLEVATSPGVVDVYAGLLYKTGRIKDAIAIQEQVVKLAEKEKASSGDADRLKLEMANLQKMKNKEPADSLIE